MALKHMNALERIHAAALATASAAAHAELKEHGQQCAACQPGRDWHLRACATGWELAKTAHAAAIAHRDYLRCPAPDAGQAQGQLW